MWPASAPRIANIIMRQGKQTLFSTVAISGLCPWADLSRQSLCNAGGCHNVLTDLSDFGVQIQSIKDSSRCRLTGCDRLNRAE
jgi:hypothetical protein